MGVVVFLPAFALSAALVALTIKICRTHGWVAMPRPDRWHQSKPALFGGIPIVVTFVGLAATFVAASDHRAWMVITASIAMFLLGLADDIWHLRPLLKLSLQLLAALWIVKVLAVHLFINSTVSWLIALLWIVGLTNAFNLLDNMDGLAAGIGFITAIGLGILYLHNGVQGLLLLALLGGASAGFLVFNFYPARIFMGDSGSLFLGFLLATTSLLGISRGPRTTTQILAPVLILALPIFDTVFVSLTRRLRGQPISQGGTDHCSHRLVRLGLEQRRVVLLLYGLAAVSGAVALEGLTLPVVDALALNMFWAFSLLLFGIYIFQPGTLADTTHVPNPFPCLENRSRKIL